MCWQCDHPGSTWDDFIDHVGELIADYGWVVQGVKRERARPPWSYTVGLTALNKPEVVVTGMRADDAADLLNDVAYHLTHADPPRHGEQIPWPGRPLLEVVRVAEPTAHLNVAASIYGPRVQAIQLVHADDRGHWPWDVGWRGMRGGQPVLGARAPQAVTT